MHPDRLLVHEGYNLRSCSHLAARDMPYTLSWVATHDPHFGAVHRFHRNKGARRKEFYESLFVVDRLAPELGRARSVVDVAAGHGLVGLLALLRFPHLGRVHLVDRRQPLCWHRALELLALDHPWMKTRVRYREAHLDHLPALPLGDLVVGVHCCGRLTDRVAQLAHAAGRDFAVVPCCESRALLDDPDEKARLTGDAIADAVNARRVALWRDWGYAVEERFIPERVTARPRMLVATRR